MRTSMATNGGNIEMETFKALLLAEYSVAQWALAFYLYSFAGWCWEVALSFAKHRRFVNRGFLTGPILPIYGFGALTVLLSCMPVKDNIALVALLGMTVATVLELVTGAAMEALFHVRYWDYSDARFNFHGYICLKSTLVWAAFSALIVCWIHPAVRSVVQRVPQLLAAVLASSFTAFTLIDTIVAVRRALDLRALLESMERYAKELEALHSSLDGVGERVSEMVRSFGASVGATHEELAARMERLAAAREQIATQVRERRLTLEEAAKERFAAFEHALSELADLVPDTSALRAEVTAVREAYDRQADALRAARERRIARARQVLRRNPNAVSRRYSPSLAALRDEEQERR